MKTILHPRRISAWILMLLTLGAALNSCCSGSNVPYPKTPGPLHLSYAARDVFRSGFQAGCIDAEQHAGADHRRHSFPVQYEDAFRCGYIRGLTYCWFSFGKADRIRREYPAYLEDYQKQFVRW